MRNRGAPTTTGDRAKAGEERSLNSVSFVGSYPTADFVTQPSMPEVAFLGRSNVGKSSLLNRLMGRRALAHTSKTPGKTRTCNVYVVTNRFYLVDLPGYGYARVSKTERRGFSRLITDYLSVRDTLVGVVWLLDIRREPSKEDLEMANFLADAGVPTLVAVTKADKVGRGQRASRIASIVTAIDVAQEQVLVTSAHTREGTEDLRESVLALVDEDA